MKRYYAAFTLTLAMLLTGCFNQDFSDCYMDDNCELRFYFDGDKDGVEFRNKISKVDVAIFDPNNRYVTNGSVTKADLDKFTGIKFTLDPGEYRVVCWANLSNDNTEIHGTSNVMDVNDLFLETVSESTGSPLYYGPSRDVSESDDIFTRSRMDSRGISIDAHKIIVKQNEVAVKNVEFTRAHRKIDVYVKGYEQVVEGSAPTIQLTNLPYRYNFLLCTDASRKDFKSQAQSVETPEGIMLMSSFATPISDFKENMALNVIRTSNGATETALNLKEWIDANEDQIDDLNEFSILLQYEKDGEVKIFINSWGDIEVDPEWPE